MKMEQQMKQRCLLTRLIAVAIFCLSLTIFQASPVFALDDSDSDGDNDEDLTSGFQNPAQAAHASQLANEVASIGNAETEEALGGVEEAEEGLEDAMATGTPDDVTAAETALADAERAYADAVSELTGVTCDDITDMRAAGMGWGDIAHELGVHPSTLGLGHGKGRNKNKTGMYAGSIETNEIAEATARNTRSGYARGHGLAMNTGVDSKTSGLGFGGKSQGHGKGHSGASGLGSGQGQAGNNGDRGDTKGGSSASSGPGNSGNSNKGGAGVAGKDGNPGGGNSGNSNGQGGGNDKGDKGDKGNNGKGHK